MRLLGSTCGAGAFPFGLHFFAASLGAVLLAGVACSETPPQRRNNVLLIVVDTLRSDHLGVYGYPVDTSPFIDDFAAQATVFSNAYTTAPWTQPAMASLFTGRYPSSHGLVRIYQKLDLGEVTLAERFASQGYATEGIVSHRLVSKKFNFDQGFERYSDEDGMKHNAISTEKVTTKAIGALETMAKGERPFFLFVHYFDPHFAYHDHPEVFIAGKGSGRLSFGLLAMNAMRKLDPPPKNAERRFIAQRYDEEIRHTDAGIGRLLAALAELDLDEDTVIALTSDHGEAIFEHGWLGHTVQLYEEVLAVPLIIRPIRSEAAPRVVGGRVSTLALTPTLLELAGLDAESDRFQAASLASWVRGDPGDPGDPGDKGEEGEEKGEKKAGQGSQPTNSIFAEVDYHPISRDSSKKRVRQQVWIDGRFKLIWDDLEGKAELYNLIGDPEERENLASRQPRRTQQLLAAMRAYQESLAASSQPAEVIAPSREEMDALRALGYVGEAEDDESLPAGDDSSGGES